MNKDATTPPEIGMQCIFCHADIPPLTGPSGQSPRSGVDGSDTRLVSVDGVSFAACREHFPPDGASAAEYEATYYRFIRRAVQAMEDLVPGASLFTVTPDTGPGHGES